MAERDAFEEAVAKLVAANATTPEEAMMALGLSGWSPEGFYVQVVWAARQQEIDLLIADLNSANS